MPARARSFDHMAEHFDRFAELVGSQLDEFLESRLPAGGGQRAVDLGCGTGRHATLLAARYQQVLAVDVSASMLQLAQARRSLPAITYRQRDLREVRADTDGVFIRELVAPGGRVVLIDNVAPRSAVPRRWFICEAIRMLVLDLVRRRRPPREAWELLRLNVDPGWLDHLTSDRFLNPQQFAERYRAIFPGAQITGLYRARALCWDAPTR